MRDLQRIMYRFNFLWPSSVTPMKRSWKTPGTVDPKGSQFHDSSFRAALAAATTVLGRFLLTKA